MTRTAFLSPGLGKGTPSQRGIYDLLLGRKGRTEIPTSVDSQLPSVQNNVYAKVAYFGTAYPDPLQYENKITSNQREESQERQKLHQDLYAI